MGVRDILGMHAPNRHLSEIPGGRDSFFDQAMAMRARYVKLLHPDHSMSDAIAARNLGLRAIVRLPGEGHPQVGDTFNALEEFCGTCWVLECGNEPDRRELSEHADALENIWFICAGQAHDAGTMLCTPGWRGNDEPPMDERVIDVYSRFDAIGLHCYGEHILEAGQIERIKRWAATFPGKDIHITEAGIAARDLIGVPPNPDRYGPSEALKARRYAQFATRVADLVPQVKSICFFIGSNSTPEWRSFNEAGKYDPNGSRSYWLHTQSWAVLGNSLP